MFPEIEITLILIKNVYLYDKQKYVTGIFLTKYGLSSKELTECINRSDP